MTKSQPNLTRVVGVVKIQPNLVCLAKNQTRLT